MANPYLYYAIFGDFSAGIEISCSGHQVTALPDEIEIEKYTRLEHPDYVESFFKGYFGERLMRDDSALFESAKTCPDCLVIKGELKEDFTFAYLKNIVGLIQCLSEQGAKCIFDMQVVRWYRAAEWQTVFESMDPVDLQYHVMIYSSEMEEKQCWLHTRGLRKFGCSDISVLNVDESSVKEALDVVNELMQLQMKGQTLSEQIELSDQCNNRLISGKLFSDLNNYDFNNSYYEFEWKIRMH